MQQLARNRSSVCRRIEIIHNASLTPCHDKDFAARHNLAESCAECRETATRWLRNIRQEIRRSVSRMSPQWPDSGNGNAVKQLSRRLARRLAMHRARTRNGRIGSLRDGSPHISTMTLKNMNTPITSTSDLEGLRKAVQEFQPNPRRVPFNGLKPVHDIIVDLRGRSASYATIADLLQQHGIKTSRARVAEYGRIAFDGGKKRKRRKQAGAAPIVNIPAPQSTVVVKPKPAAPAPADASVNNVTSPPKESSPYRSRGPHIANVRMMAPAEAKEFNDSLKPGNAPKP